MTNRKKENGNKVKKTPAKKQKRAVVSATFIITVILVILFLLIGFFFIGRIGFRDLVNQEACHESIIFRDTFNVGKEIEVGRSLLPLQCQTQKLCFNTGNLLTRSFKEGFEWKKAKGDCEEFKNAKSGVKTVNIKASTKEDKQKEVIANIADEMASCWKTVGEGYLDYTPRTEEFGKHVYCSICSRIAFDESAKDIGPISYEKLYKYMETTTLPSITSTRQNSYLKFLYNRESLDNLRQEIIDIAEGKKEAAVEGIDLKLYPQKDIYKISIDTNKEYAVVTLFKKEGWGGFATFAAGGAIVGVATVVGAVLAGIPTGGIGTVIILAGAGAGGGAFLFSQHYDTVETTPPALIVFDEDNLRALNCGTFEWIP